MRQRATEIEYKYVVHATEQQRRNKYKGCVSRQVLRANLRTENIAAMKEDNNVGGRKSKSEPRMLGKKARRLGIVFARQEYRRLMNLG